MHQAIPYRTWPLVSTISRIDALANIDNKSNNNNTTASSAERIRGLILENPVLVIGRHGCCMCHVVRRLLLGLGVNPSMYEVKDDEQVGVVQELAGDQRLQFPAVFIGGRLVGGLDRLMAVHISGDLVPILKEAGALWL